MVLEGNRGVGIDGRGNRKSGVSVSIEGEKKKRIGDKKGKWEVMLDGIKGGDNYEVWIESGEE